RHPWARTRSARSTIRREVDHAHGRPRVRRSTSAKGGEGGARAEGARWRWVAGARRGGRRGRSTGEVEGGGWGRRGRSTGEGGRGRGGGGGGGWGGGGRRGGGGGGSGGGVEGGGWGRRGRSTGEGGRGREGWAAGDDEGPSAVGRGASVVVARRGFEPRTFRF